MRKDVDDIKDYFYETLVGWIRAAYTEGYGKAKRNDIKPVDPGEVQREFDVSHSKRHASSSMKFFVEQLVDMLLDVRS